MVEAQQGASILARFQSNFEGRRNKKIGDEGITAYTYDGHSELLEYDGAGLQKTRYEYGQLGLIASYRRDEPWRFIQLDVVSSVVGLTDAAGSAVADFIISTLGANSAMRAKSMQVTIVLDLPATGGIRKRNCIFSEHDRMTRLSVAL